MTRSKRAFSSILAVATLSAALPAMTYTSADPVMAADSYPVQEFRIAIGDTNRNVNISGFGEGAPLNSWTTNGEDNEKWTLNYISDGVYEIVNSATGYLITANSNGTCTIAADTNASNQRWNIEGVQKDHEGYNLYYKIVSNADSSKALTFIPESNSFITSSYSDNLYQKYKLNLDGLEGFAANCVVTQGEKAGVIGGLLGKTVTVSTAEELKSALDSKETMTIVVSGNIDCSAAGDFRVRDNKTIVGAYGAGIQDCQIRTNDKYGAEDDAPSDNIIFRNIAFTAAKNEDKILIQIWSSRNIWVDHCTFNSTLDRNRDEVGKFIWINTPYDSYLDAKDLDRSPDYITLSYNIFRNRYWTVAYGTQNSETTRCRTSVMYNWWDECVRRCPQIGNGIGHIYNNYFSGNDSGNDSGTAQIIGGDGSHIVSENCRFQSLTGTEIIAGGGSDPYRDNGSYTSTSSSSVPSKLTFSPKVPSTWYPSSSNYGYALIDAYNTKGSDTKDFCLAYSGCFSSKDQIKYITDSDMTGWITTKYAAPFLKEITVGGSDLKKTGAVMDTSVKYMFKNVNSGLYMEVEGAAAANGTNVQQWGADADAVHNTWKLMDAGDGYYYIRSCVGDGKTYYLDLDYGKTDDGTNIGIYAFTDCDAQKFKFVDNGNGTYTITTKATDDDSCIGIEEDSAASGANVLQWTRNGSDSQKWTLETITIKDGAVLDESTCYMIQNVNSGRFMEVQDGTAADDANVQQWAADTNQPAAHNVWRIRAINWGYYTIYSGVGDGNTFLLNVDNGNNGTNITIHTNNKQSTQYFKFVDNEDGTYTIVTRASKDLSCVEVASASTQSGGNVQQWEWNDNNCQKWKLIPVDYTLPFQTTTATTTTTTSTTTTTTTTTTTASTAPSATSTTSTTTTTTTTASATTVSSSEAASETKTTTASSATSTAETTTTTSATTTASAASSGQNTDTAVYGDVNLDNTISLIDVVILNKHLANSVVFSPQQKINADCCADGILNSSDTTALIRFIVELIHALPVIPDHA